MSRNIINCKKCKTQLTLPYIVDWNNGRKELCSTCFGKIEKSHREEMFAYHETNEQRPNGQIGWNQEKNAWITLWDHKQRVVYTPQDEKPNDNPNTTSKCSQCQGEFTKQGDKILYWVEEGKEEIRFCCSCKDKKEQSSGHRSSMKPMTSSDPNIRTYEFCPFCRKNLDAKQSHDYKDGKWNVKHECKGKCGGYYGSLGLHEKCEKQNTYKWTQENINLLWDKKFEQGMCPDCRIKSLNWDAGLGDEEAKKILAEVKKLIGKDNSPPPQVLTLEIFQEVWN